MTGAEIVAIVLGIVEGGMRLASVLIAKLDPAEATIARARLADGIHRRADRITADEAAELAAVPK
jgi:hypothetical protein